MRKVNAQGNTKQEAWGFQSSTRKSVNVILPQLLTPETAQIPAQNIWDSLTENFLLQDLSSGASTAQLQPKILSELPSSHQTLIHKMNHPFQGLCSHWQPLHSVLITLCSSSQFKHLSTASAQALYLIEWVKFQVGTFWMLSKQERMKFLISVKYTFDIITWKLISVMHTRRKKGKKYLKYLRVDIFCWFIWFQTWLFLPFLDNITLKEHKNFSLWKGLGISKK